MNDVVAMENWRLLILLPEGHAQERLVGMLACAGMQVLAKPLPLDNPFP